MGINVQVTPQYQSAINLTGSDQPSSGVSSGSTQITASSTCTAADNGLLFVNNTTSNYTKTIPANIGTDFGFAMVQGSTGTVGIVAGAGVTLIGSSTATTGQGQIIGVINIAPNTYIVKVN